MVEKKKKQMGSENYKVKSILAMSCDFSENGCYEGDYSQSDLHLSLKKIYMYHGGSGRI